MRDRSNEKVEEKPEDVKPLIKLIQKNTGISEEEAYLFHLEMWVYVHGIATMVATDYFEWNVELISRVLTDGYKGLEYRYTHKEVN
jgi:spore coat protein CotH